MQSMLNQQIKKMKVSYDSLFFFLIFFIYKIFYYSIEDLRLYIKQLRLETGIRVLAKVYENTDKPSKVSCY